MRSPRSLRFVFALLAGTLTGVGVAAYVTSTLEADPSRIDGLLWPEPKELPQFALLDHRQARFDRARLEGRWSFLFFGYTHCPDVCPLTLARVARAKELMEPDAAERLQVVLVTVDPERDTPEATDAYAKRFDPDFRGLSGARGEIERVASAFGVFRGRARGEAGEGERYLVDHTASLLVLDEDGRVRMMLGQELTAAEMAGDFEWIVR